MRLMNARLLRHKVIWLALCVGVAFALSAGPTEAAGLAQEMTIGHNVNYCGAGLAEPAKVAGLTQEVTGTLGLTQEVTGTVGILQKGTEDASCLQCHSNPNLKITLPSGEPLSLYVDAKTYGTSVHGKQRLACVTCHTNIVGYPHPPLIARDRRDVTLRTYTECRRCHKEEYAKTLDSIHTKELASGNRNAPVCTDCHGSHDIVSPNKPRSRILHTC